MSHYDYPDPGLDPVYCDGAPDEPDPPLCFWCSDSFSDDRFAPYCSSLCVAQAWEDSAFDVLKD